MRWVVQGVIESRGNWRFHLIVTMPSGNENVKKEMEAGLLAPQHFKKWILILELPTFSQSNYTSLLWSFQRNREIMRRGFYAITMEECVSIEEGINKNGRNIFKWRIVFSRFLDIFIMEITHKNISVVIQS